METLQTYNNKEYISSATQHDTFRKIPMQPEPLYRSVGAINNFAGTSQSEVIVVDGNEPIEKRRAYAPTSGKGCPAAAECL
jgi:hypothetical protein